MKARIRGLVREDSMAQAIRITPIHRAARQAVAVAVATTVFVVMAVLLATAGYLTFLLFLGW